MRGRCLACAGRLLDERVARRDELAEAVAVTEVRIAAAARAAGRERSELTLVAVSKTWPASDVLLLASLGLRDFGENRVQEGVRKAADVAARMTGVVRWHFVGRLQRNKCRTVAGFASLVHSVDRPELVTALASGAVVADRQLDVLLQVSLDRDRVAAARCRATSRVWPVLSPRRLRCACGGSWQSRRWGRPRGPRSPACGRRPRRCAATIPMPSS